MDPVEDDRASRRSEMVFTPSRFMETMQSICIRIGLLYSHGHLTERQRSQRKRQLGIDSTSD